MMSAAEQFNGSEAGLNDRRAPDKLIVARDGVRRTIQSASQDIGSRAAVKRRFHGFQNTGRL